MLEIKDISIKVGNNEILKNINLSLSNNQVIALMGKNGSGKTSLSFALMGHPDYQILKGKIILNGKDITNLKPNERAKEGLFLSFQHPENIPGVTIANFLRTVYNSLNNAKVDVVKYRKELYEKMDELNIDRAFANRYLNEGFSGGEMKKMEVLQMNMLSPKYAIIDEVDSGIDSGAIKIVGGAINKLRKNTSILIITHYTRIFKHVTPDKVFIVKDGRIVKEGGIELANKIDKEGYDWL